MVPYLDSVFQDCISALKQENEHLKQEAAQLKAELEYWEVRNGGMYNCTLCIVP